MTSTTAEFYRTSILGELDSIANWYQFGDGVDQYLPRLKGHIERYLELTFQPDQYEIITGGEGEHCFEDFCLMAKQLGIHRDTIDLFTSAYRRFPKSILGFKIPIQQDRVGSPSLYVRSKCAKEKVFAWLLDSGLSHWSLKELAVSMKDNECFYGLGFTSAEGEPLLKTYTINRLDGGNPERLGFVSHRIRNQKILSARKEYVPDVPIQAFDPPSEEWEKLLNFLVKEMRYRTAGHLGYVVDDRGISHPKIYVERIGAIPTDFEAT